MTDQAWRLVFAYDGENLTLTSTQRLTKRVPPGREAGPGRRGRFVELRGPDREVLYRRAVDHLIPATVEYPTGDPEQPLGRAAAPRRGEVIIFVPAEPDARSVAIVAVDRPVSSGRRKTAKSAEAGPPRDLISVDLPQEGQRS